MMGNKREQETHNRQFVPGATLFSFSIYDSRMSLSLFFTTSSYEFLLLFLKRSEKEIQVYYFEPE